MKSALLLALFICTAFLTFGQRHEISLTARGGVPESRLSKAFLTTRSAFAYAEVITSNDKGLYLNYNFKFSKKLNLYLTTGVGYAQTLNHFPIFARESYYQRLIHLVEHKKNRLQVSYIGLRKRFYNKSKNFSLDIGFIMNDRFFSTGRDYLVETEYQSTPYPWIEYRYDIEVIYDEYMNTFSVGENEERVGRVQFDYVKFDIELTGRWKLTERIDFMAGAALSPRHIFFYDADYESRKYLNGELNPAEYVNYIGTVGDPDWNGKGQKNNFYYLTSGLTYKFQKREKKKVN